MSAERPTSTPACGACGFGALRLAGSLPLYVRGGDVSTRVWRCSACGTYMRDFDYDQIGRLGHFEVSSYTNPEAERSLYRSRQKFFNWLTGLALRHLGRPPAQLRVCDIGCSYGHQLQALAAQGTTCTGVEVVTALRECLQRTGIAAYPTIEALPPEARFDMIFLIDTLYYLPDPQAALRCLHVHLAESGILLVRVANRVPLLNLLSRTGCSLTNMYFGDAKFNFSYAGIRHLLTDSGFRVIDVRQHERGKRGLRPSQWLYYKLGALGGWISRRKLAPGLVLVCRPTEFPAPHRHQYDRPVDTVP